MDRADTLPDIVAGYDIPTNDHLLPSVRTAINAVVSGLYACDDNDLARLHQLKAGCSTLAEKVLDHAVTPAEIIDALLSVQRVKDMVAIFGDELVVGAINAAVNSEPPDLDALRYDDAPMLTGQHADTPPFDGVPPVGFPIAPVLPAKLPPLTISQWEARELPPPDFIMGDWLTTTTRAMLTADTGLGKTNFAMGLAMHTAAGTDFLHWRGRRPSRVLYIDGEMARRLYRQRITDAAHRLGSKPEGFHALSREDLDMPPLNSPEGQALIEHVMRTIGPVDLIVFDSIMCLLAGDMKDGEPWASVIPWARSLTQRSIGQIWVHHTGHDKSRSYGDKTKEWQLDTVLHMDPAEHPETDVCFTLEFKKARERTPATRADFADTKVMLLDDAWQSDGRAVSSRGHVSPLGIKFFGALTDALAGEEAPAIAGRRSTTIMHWRAECAHLGLIDPTDKPDSARNLFNKHKRELIAANWIACNEDSAWTI